MEILNSNPKIKLAAVLAVCLFSFTSSAAPLRRVNLNLEKLRVFWRLIHDRHWISQQQLLFAAQRLDEIGRMAGGWLKQVERKNSPHS